MRRICSLVWKLMSTIQKIGKRKKSSTSASATPRRMRGHTGAWTSVRGMGPLPQLQPMLHEDVGERIGQRPEDHHQRGRTADIGVLEELQVGAHLEDHEAV